jgi:hypothetical protein
MDEKEKARRLSLSMGKAEGGYTSPPRPVRRMTDGVESQRKPGGRESISTLWSIGDSPDRH